MHSSSSTAAFVAGVAIVVAMCGSGCRLVRQRGPVPADLAAARRLSNEGLSAVDHRDLARAEKLLERAVQSCPLDVDARRHYAEVLWKRGERTAAVMQVAEALKLSPEDAGLCVEGGRMYLELGLFGDAERLSREAVLAMLGPSTFTRRDGPAEILRYATDDCFLTLFLHRGDQPRGGTLTVHHVDANARSRAAAGWVNARTCYGQVLELRGISVREG